MTEQDSETVLQAPQASQNIAAMMAKAGGQRRSKQQAESPKDAQGSYPEVDLGPLWRGPNGKSNPPAHVPPLKLTGSGYQFWRSTVNVPQSHGNSGPPVQRAYPYIPKPVLKELVNWLQGEIDNECLFEGINLQVVGSDGELIQRSSARSFLSALEYQLHRAMPVQCTASLNEVEENLTYYHNYEVDFNSIQSCNAVLNEDDYEVDLTGSDSGATSSQKPAAKKEMRAAADQSGLMHMLYKDILKQHSKGGSKLEIAKLAQKELEQVLAKEEIEAATRLQAFHRGKATRKRVNSWKRYRAVFNDEGLNSVRSDLDFLALEAGQVQTISEPARYVSRSPIPQPQGDNPLPVPRFYMPGGERLVVRAELFSVYSKVIGTVWEAKRIERLHKMVKPCRSLPAFAGDTEPLPEPFIDLSRTRHCPHFEHDICERPSRWESMVFAEAEQYAYRIEQRLLEELDMDLEARYQDAAIKIQAIARGRMARQETQANQKDKAHDVTFQVSTSECSTPNRASTTYKASWESSSAFSGLYMAPSKDDEVCSRQHYLRWHAWHCRRCAKRGHGLRWGCVECPEANICRSCNLTLMMDNPQTGSGDNPQTGSGLFFMDNHQYKVVS